MEFLFADLTYKINGILIETHKELGPYARERQVADLLKKKLKEKGYDYKREVRIGDTGNIADFIIEGKVIIELKTIPFFTTECFDQLKRYFTQTNLQLGILVNFRSQRIQIKRVLNPNNI